MVVSKSAIQVGTKVWLPQGNDQYDLAEVSARDGSTAELKHENGKIKNIELDKKTRKKLFIANEKVLADMTNLSYFHLPGILHNLRERAISDEPYTFMSQGVLCAINPLKDIKDPKGVLGSSKAIMTPHPYAIAESAFQQLLFALRRGEAGSETPTNQSIIIGGESGAGKTTSAKFVLKHLVRRVKNDDSKDNDMDTRLLESNPILEAFGNAATKRNHNSSRFGKFLKLHFKAKKKAKHVQIYGASVVTYLLERSRVTFHIEGERTYHIFYQLISGAGKKLRKKCKLDDVEFAYLTPRKPSEGHGASAGGKKSKKVEGRLPTEEEDKANFKELVKALQSIGIEADEDEELFPTIAAILHLGNVNFHDEDSSQGSSAAVKDDAPLKAAASLLGVKSSKLLKLFTQYTVKTVGDEVTKHRDSRGAKYALDAVVKALYSGVFDWIVKGITKSLSERGDLEELPFIGVLDIFGFETFATNDFEQLLINYTNETLQLVFNQQIFLGEMDLYKREGLLVDDMEMPPENTDCVNLLQGGDGVRGILTVIDDEAKNPGAQDEKLNAALHRQFKNHKNFPKVHPKDARSCFMVEHYAGKVKYTVGSFLEKNTDNLPTEVGKAFKDSSLDIIKKTFKKNDEDNDEGSSKKKKKKTKTSIAGKFKKQMEELVETVMQTRCTFIRCIKPNARMKRGSKEWFDNSYILPQLINLSIQQTAEVLKGGLPTRVQFGTFKDDFGSLLPKDAMKLWKTLGNKDERRFVQALFFAYDIDPESYKIGKTMVFFASGKLDQVNDLLNTAMGGSKIDKEVVKKFKYFFKRVVLRRIRAKVIVIGYFSMKLREVHEARKQREYEEKKRQKKAEEARRKAEIAKERKEKEKAELKKQEKIAREKKKRVKELKKAKAEAETQEEKDGIDLEIRVIKGQASEADRKAKTLSMRATTESNIRKSIRQSMRASSMGSAIRKSFRRSYAPARSHVERDAEEEEESRFILPEGVQYMIPQSKKVGFLRRPASAFNPGSPRKPSGGLGSLACFSRFMKRRNKQERPRHLSEDESHAGSRTSASTVSEESWVECGIVLAGIELRYYLETGRDWNGEGVPEGKYRITDSSIISPSDEDSMVLQIGTRENKDQLRIRFEDANNQQEFFDAFKRAQRGFEYEILEAEKFARGELDLERNPQMQEYKDMLDMELITQEQFEMALFQQVTSDDEFLAVDAAMFGEEGVADFKSQCSQCFDFYFNLPTDPITECPNCGNTKLDSPEELEQEAKAARMKLIEERNAAFKKGNLDKQTGFPFYMELGEERYSFEKPETEERLENGTNMSVFFVLPWSRGLKGSDEEWDDFFLSATFNQLVDFFEEEVPNTGELDDELVNKIPKFPTEAAGHNVPEQLRAVTIFFLELLKVVGSENLFQYQFMRRFFGTDM